MYMFGIAVLLFFTYIFTAVVAYKFMKDVLGWKEGAETPLPLIWPLLLMGWLFLVLPVMFFFWVVNSVPKKLKKKIRKAKTKPQEVK